MALAIRGDPRHPRNPRSMSFAPFYILRGTDTGRTVPAGIWQSETFGGALFRFFTTGKLYYYVIRIVILGK